MASELGGRVVEVYGDEGEPCRPDALVVDAAPGHGLAPSWPENRCARPWTASSSIEPVEPGEVVAAGSALLTIADLTDLTLTVYVPEDRYGHISWARPTR